MGKHTITRMLEAERERRRRRARIDRYIDIGLAPDAQDFESREAYEAALAKWERDRQAYEEYRAAAREGRIHEDPRD